MRAPLAHFLAPGLDVSILSDGLVRGVGESEHLGDIRSQDGPQDEHVLRVRVVPVASGGG